MDEFKELSKEEIIKRFASLEFNSFLDYYKNAPDLNAPVDESRRMDSDRAATVLTVQVCVQTLPVCSSI